MPVQSTLSSKQLAFNSEAAIHIVRTLLYADIFDYPMTAHEVYQNLSTSSSSENQVQEVLGNLVKHGLVFQHGFLYSLSKRDESCDKRKEKNKLAKKYMPWAHRISKFIGAFPFVEGVFLSGSISKDCMEKDGDIDYFIVTKPGRLWLSRTMLIAFKKIFLLNSYKYFCLNYFVDTEHMLIQKRNIYTATEIVTLIPSYGRKSYEAFLECNAWARKYRPNFPVKISASKERSASAFKKSMEFLLGGWIGDYFERVFHKTTERHWQKKFSKYSSRDYQLSIQTSKHTSQINPENFHKKVLEEFEEKILKFEKTHGVSLNKG